MKTLLKTSIFLWTIIINAQVGIGTTTPAEGALLDISGNGAVIFPRISLISPTSKSPIISPLSTTNLVNGMILYNTNSNLAEMPEGTGFYFWNDNKWEALKPSATPSTPVSSLWYKTGITPLTPATSFNEKIVRNAAVTLGDNTDRPGAILNLETNNKGLLLPRVALVALNSKEPLITTSTTSMEAGMTVYHTGVNNIEEGVYYWDGLKWKRLFVNTSTNTGNDGVVKINSGGGISQTKPTLSLTKNGNEFGTFVDINYTSSLNYATVATNWPENVENPTDADIYNFTTNKFLENKVSGQVHMWRVILSFAPSNASPGSLLGKIYDTTSGFETTSVQLIPGGNAQSTASFLFFTIANSESIENGYKIAFSANANINVEVESVTRVSLFKD